MYICVLRINIYICMYFDSAGKAVKSHSTCLIIFVDSNWNTIDTLFCSATRELMNSYGSLTKMFFNSRKWQQHNNKPKISSITSRWYSRSNSSLRKLFTIYIESYKKWANRYEYVCILYIYLYIQFFFNTHTSNVYMVINSRIVVGTQTLINKLMLKYLSIFYYNL